MPEGAEARSRSPAQFSNCMLNIAIVEQVEYYFGDFNMMRDKFLQQEVTKNDGWIPIKTLLRFNRLNALTQNIDAILVAFTDSESTLVEINNETKSIRRNPDRPLPENNDAWRAAITERSIYIKGFPAESTTMDNILKFLQPLGKVDNVYMRNYRDKALKDFKFKGSVFVAFPTKEDAERFLSIGSMKYEGNDLIRMWQAEYIEKKKLERLEAKMKAKDLKTQMLKEKNGSVIQEIKKLPKGALIELTGLPENMRINKLKTTLAELEWEVHFVDYTAGETTAIIRLQTEDSAKTVLSKLKDNELQFDGITAKAHLIEGEREEEILKKMTADRESKVLENLAKGKKKSGKKFNKNQGGNRFDRNRSNKDKEDSERSNKQKSKEAFVVDDKQKSSKEVENMDDDAVSCSLKRKNPNEASDVDEKKSKC